VYRLVMWISGLAAFGTVIYATIAIAAAVEGPDSALHIPTQINTVVVATLGLTFVLAGTAWLIRSGNRDTAAQDIRPIVAAELEAALRAASDRLAAAVTHDVAGLLEQRLQKVADKTAAGATARTVTAVREIAAAEREAILNDLDTRMESWLKRAQTMWMIAETGSRAGNGTVASINARRDT
jgi:hypothetical protein